MCRVDLTPDAAAVKVGRLLGDLRAAVAAQSGQRHHRGAAMIARGWGCVCVCLRCGTGSHCGGPLCGGRAVAEVRVGPVDLGATDHDQPERQL